MKLKMAFKNYCSQVPSILRASFSNCHASNNVHAGCFQRMQEDGQLLDPAFPNWGILETWVKVDKKKYKACLMATDANIACGTVTHMQFCAQQS